MELDDFEPLFGEPKVEWSATNSITTPIRPFLFQVHAPDSSSLRVNVTDFFSNSFGAIRSIQELEDMRDDTGIGGSWSEFLEYLVNSIKFGDVKLVLEGQSKSDGPESVRLVAQKSKGMPRISVFLHRLVGTAANEVMARLSLGLYKAFKSNRKLLDQEEEGRYRLTKMLPAAEQEKNDHIQTELDASHYSKRHKIRDKVTLDASSSATLLHDVSGDQPPRSRRRYRDGQREIGEARLMEDYFIDNPTFDEVIFRRRFRMRRSLFLRIVDVVTANDEYFPQKPDATGRQGLSPLQKCTAAMRVLAYGASADAVDEYLRMGASTTRKALLHFVDGVISCLGDEYLRKPNETDLARLLYVGDQRGFPGMIGSIDCMHWEWKNCPSAWAGQYAGRSGKPTIILEAVASYDLWIWHAFFGTPGSLNDINVLHRSPIFDDVLAGRSPKVSYVVNGHEYNRAYYLTDGIYPSWAAFVKSITSPQMQKHKLFAQVQEACRKDVERAFGVLQARFAFIRRPCLVWDRQLTGRIMIACIIMHNKIVEDERGTYANYYDPTEFINDMPTNGQQRSSTEDDGQSTGFSTERIANLSCYMANREQLRNRETHNALKIDLIEHIWQKMGQNN